MTSTHECLQMIDLAYEAAADSESSYVLPTRLKRVVLFSQKLLTQNLGLKSPTLPGFISVPDGTDINILSTVKIINILYSQVARFSSKSEALQEKINRYSSDISQLLQELRGAIVRLDTKSVINTWER